MRVLVADDEAISRRLLESNLKHWGYEPIVVNDGTAASAVLLSPDAPTLAILDWQMPGVDGVQLCRDIRRNKPEPYTYIMMLTGKRNKRDVIDGLDSGADDYVVKPFDPAELKVRLRTGKRILYLQDQLISAREALRDQATRDSLTGIWNRAAISKFLNDELQRARRQDAPLGIAMIDLDFFKQINGTHGHPAGDVVLRRVAEALQGSVRRYDAVGRYGGEEFLVVLPGCDACNAMARAERIREAVAAVIVETHLGTISPTASVGVVVTTSHCGFENGELIETADRALYLAKRNGRNRVEYAAVESLLSAT